RQGGVIWMRDPAPGEALRVADHLAPALAPAHLLRKGVEAPLAQPVGMIVADVHRVAAATEREPHDVWLAARAAAQRLPPQDQAWDRLEPPGHRDEEPFTLAPKGAGATPKPILGPKPTGRRPHDRGLEPLPRPAAVDDP